MSLEVVEILVSREYVEAITYFVMTHNDRRTLSHRAVIGKLIREGREITGPSPSAPRPHPWEEYAHEHDECYLVIEWAREGETSSIVGVGGFAIDGNRNARRSFTVVHRDHRRRGIGTRILEKKLDLATRAQARRFRVEVGMTNAPSVKLVEKVGFEEYGIGERNGHEVILYEYNRNSVAVAARGLSALFG